MSTKGKEYKLMVRIAGEVDKTFGSSMSSIKKEVKAVKKMTADETFSVLDKGFNKIENVGKKALNAIKRAAELTAAAVSAIGIAAINAGSDFEAAMSTVEAISGANDSQMEDLTDKARELSRNSIYSGTEIADAMQYMGMAGWKTEQILAGIEPILNLATASGEDFAMVSDIVTDNLTAFNMTADEAGRMADVLAAAAMNSNTNVAKMGNTFKYAGSVAGALNFSIEDVAIATGLMASSGVKANMAGTALRNIFTRMVKPTKDAKEAMKAFGVEITEIDPKTGEEKIKSLMDIMLQMRESVSGKSQADIKALVDAINGGDTAQLSEEEKKYYESLSEEELDALVLSEELTSSEKEQYEAMSQVEKAYYAAGLAGQRGMTGLLTILNASDEDFKKLTEAIYGSAGAAEYMASVKTDNLKSDIKILKDNVQDAGIELYNTFSGDLRELVQNATDFIRDNIKNIPKWFNDISAEFATFKRKAKKFIEPVFNLIVGTAKWLIKNKSAVIGVLAGIGTTLVTYKIASGLSHTITAISSFVSAANPLALAITGVAGAIGVITGAIVAYKQYKQECINNDLAEHFGTLKLSISELDDVAHTITDDGVLTTLKKQLEAFDELEVLKDTIENALNTDNKIMWKVSLGIEMTEEEKNDYLKAAEEAGEAQVEYAEQTAYAVSQLFPGEDAVSLKVKQFYIDNMDTMRSLGENLAELVNEGYKKKFLDSTDLENIANVQKQMAEIQEAISLGQQEAKLAVLGQEYGGGKALDYETFQNLQEKLAEVQEENKEIINDVYVKKYAAFAATYGGAENIPAEVLQELNSERTQKIAESSAKAVKFQLDTIMATYGSEINAVKEDAENTIREFFGRPYNTQSDVLWQLEHNDSSIETYLNRMIKELPNAANVSEDASAAINQLVENMQSQIDNLIALSTTEGLSDKAKESISEQIESMKSDMAEIMATGLVGEDGAYLGGYGLVYDSLTKMIENGDLNETEAEVAKQLTGFIERTGNKYVEDAKIEINRVHQMTLEELKMAYKAGFDVETELRLRLNTTIAEEALKRDFYDMYSSGGSLELWSILNHNANGGLVKDMQLSWLAEQGPEMVVPLDGSRRAFSLWEQAGQFMNGSLMDKYNISGNGSEAMIEYSPTLQFYGDAPDSDDIQEALRLSQEEFEEMMERYLKKKARLAF